MKILEIVPYGTYDAYEFLSIFGHNKEEIVEKFIDLKIGSYRIDYDGDLINDEEYDGFYDKLIQFRIYEKDINEEGFNFAKRFISSFGLMNYIIMLKRKEEYLDETNS